MPVYLVETAGKRRVVEARTAKVAISYVVSGEVKSTLLTTSTLAEVIRTEGLMIERVEATPAVDAAVVSP